MIQKAYSLFYRLASGQEDDYVETFTGLKFYPLAPEHDQVCIEDVARSLSMLCRYNGHVRAFYSVAEHCCLIMDHAEDEGYEGEDLLAALMHDCSEAYTSDIPRPLKNMIPFMKVIEGKIEAVALTKFGLDPAPPAWVKDYDKRIVRDERAQAKKTMKNKWYHDRYEPLGVQLQFWSPERAEIEFMTRYRDLMAKRAANAARMVA